MRTEGQSRGFGGVMERSVVGAILVVVGSPKRKEKDGQHPEKEAAQGNFRRRLATSSLGGLDRVVVVVDDGKEVGVVFFVVFGEDGEARLQDAAVAGVTLEALIFAAVVLELEGVVVVVLGGGARLAGAALHRSVEAARWQREQARGRRVEAAGADEERFLERGARRRGRHEDALVRAQGGEAVPRRHRARRGRVVVVVHHADVSVVDECEGRRRLRQHLPALRESRRRQDLHAHPLAPRRGELASQSCRRCLCLGEEAAAARLSGRTWTGGGAAVTPR
mmetsp:Transcript_4153/g.12891  ORF Transcript_4153/g.12891 Transcript_4153/m.12891 type:complete len:279 (-) Transcript_4153:31-867(-)